MMKRTTFSAPAVRGKDRGYVAYHAPRYAYLLELLEKCGLGAGSRLLDIGPSPFTPLIRHHFGAQVDSLGFGPDTCGGGGRHFEFDLNVTQREENFRRDLPAYDIVLLAEVIEHVHTAPELVLGFIKTLLVDNGLLILQTPNAASLPKRVKLLFGRNPYEMIRTDPSNPGHFREYTIRELEGLAQNTGFRIEMCITAFYFDARFAGHMDGHVEPRRIRGSVKNALYRLFPNGLREGITMVWRIRRPSRRKSIL